MAQTQEPVIEQVVRKLRTLTPERVSEVMDFVDFLSQRDCENRLRQDYAGASEDSFARVWDNDEDAIYDQL